MNNLLGNNSEKNDGILISNFANISYLVGNFGFSQSQRECFILITKNKKFIITDGRYSEAVKKKTKGYEVLDIGVGLFLRKSLSDIFNKNKIKKLGIEEYDLKVREFKLLRKSAKLFPIDLSDLRIIKRPDEIKNIKLACKIGDGAFGYIIKQIKPGVSEIQISDKLEEYIKNKGADISFKPIVAFGKNSSVPHHISGKTKLGKNQIVLLDFGVKVNNYCSDMTRTLFAGRAPAKFKKIHQTVLEAQQKAIEHIKNFYLSSEVEKPSLNKTNMFSTSSNNKLLASEIDKIARDFIVSKNYPTIPHSLGHGIGIEVHEPPSISPNSKIKIRQGMIFSVEPGIYIEGFGGVRIEDLVLVKNNNTALLTNSKRELFEL